jgi:hypothetical protein
VQRQRTAPATVEDEQADLAVARGRNAGGVWIIASVLAFGAGLLARSFGTFAIAWLIGGALFSIGLLVRARYWRAARRRLGDATIQRARWRSIEADRERPERAIVAILIVLVLLGLEVWRR